MGSMLLNIVVICSHFSIFGTLETTRAGKQTMALWL